MRDYATLINAFKAGCVFCQVDERILIWQDDELQVCFDASPLVPGHLILSSREHYGCAGELPRILFDRLTDVRAAIGAQLLATFGAASFYEHGRAGHCLSDGMEHRLCHHFHLHCVPLEVDISAELARRFDSVPIPVWQDLAEAYEEYGSYLYAADRSGRGTMYVADETVETHLLRTLVAQQIGVPERANWRAADLESILDEGVSRLPAAKLAAALEALPLVGSRR